MNVFVILSDIIQFVVLVMNTIVMFMCISIPGPRSTSTSAALLAIGNAFILFILINKLLVR